MLAYIKAQLTDSIPITITLTALQLENLGVQDVQKGDYCWVTLEPFGIDLELRVSEVDDYNTGKPPAYTFGVLQRKTEDILSGLSKTAASVPLIGKAATNAYNSRILSVKVGEVND